jgi:DNA polymerase III epsilon subunit-like protein
MTLLFAKRPYVSIDIETTGLDPSHDQILEIGAVLDTWDRPVEDLPRFHCYVAHEHVQGSPYALSMHPTILRRIATKEKGYDYLGPGNVADAFLYWLLDEKINPQCPRITCAGKNFGSFDRQFLTRLPDWDGTIPMQHRSIDPGNLYWDPRIDRGLPDLKTCMGRAGIGGEVAHTAVEDALVVVKLIRNWEARHLV